MSKSLLEITVDERLKNKAAEIFDDLGIDISSAVRMFLKRVVVENGIPFNMTVPKRPYKAERAYRALLELGEEARKNGTDKMTLEEIDAEIDSVRRERLEREKLHGSKLML